MKFTLLSVFACSPAAVIRGVAPEVQSKYLQSLHCGGEEVALSAINDDYCDCDDGSDEPGTGACSGQEATLFHCPNVESTPQVVYASRVGDGICDCCDDSDEAHLLGQRACPNTCREEGQRQSAEREKKLEDLRAGLKVKLETISQAKQQKQEKEEQIQRINGELPGLEAQLTELLKKKEEADAVRLQADCKTELPRLRQKVKDLEEKLASLESQLARVQGETTSTTTKKVVSEYAKWMDGADAMEDEKDETDMEPDTTSQDTQEVDGGVASNAVSSDRADQEEDPLEKELKEMEGVLKSNKDLRSRLTKELEELREEHFGFASLRDKCLEFKSSEYTYKLCFFKDAKQSFTRLGNWDGFTSPTEAVFKNGEMCFGGPARSLKVSFQCGATEEVVSLDEPSRCNYAAVVRHSGACVETMMEELESPRIRHPKEEL